MSNVSEVLVSLVMQNLSPEDRAALETAIAEKLTEETAALLKRRDDLKADVAVRQAALDGLRSEVRRMKEALKD